MYPARRLTIPALLLVAGCPTAVLGADGWLSLMLEGAIEPMSYERSTDVTTANAGVVSSSDATAMDMAWRVGVTGLLRIPTLTPIRPTIGVSLNLDTLQNSVNGGEPDMYPNPAPGAPGYVAPPPANLMRYSGHLWTTDLMVGLSWLVSNHIIIDALPFVGVGRGHATSNISYINGNSMVFNPDLSMREIGVRLGLTFIGDLGMSFTFFGGICRRYMDENGNEFDTVNFVTTMSTRNDTTRYTDGEFGILWGYTF